MTTDMMSFRDLVEMSPDADLLREVIGFVSIGVETRPSIGAEC